MNGKIMKVFERQYNVEKADDIEGTAKQHQFVNSRSVCLGENWNKDKPYHLLFQDKLTFTKIRMNFM